MQELEQFNKIYLQFVKYIIFYCRNTGIQKMDEFIQTIFNHHSSFDASGKLLGKLQVNELVQFLHQNNIIQTITELQHSLQGKYAEYESLRDNITDDKYKQIFIQLEKLIDIRSNLIRNACINKLDLLQNIRNIYNSKNAQHLKFLQDQTQKIDKLSDEFQQTIRPILQQDTLIQEWKHVQESYENWEMLIKKQIQTDLFRSHAWKYQQIYSIEQDPCCLQCIDNMTSTIHRVRDTLSVMQQTHTDGDHNHRQIGKIIDLIPTWLDTLDKYKNMASKQCQVYFQNQNDINPYRALMMISKEKLTSIATIYYTSVTNIEQTGINIVNSFNICMQLLDRQFMETYKKAQHDLDQSVAQFKAQHTKSVEWGEKMTLVLNHLSEIASITNTEAILLNLQKIIQLYNQIPSQFKHPSPAVTN